MLYAGSDLKTFFNDVNASLVAECRTTPLGKPKVAKAETIQFNEMGSTGYSE